MKTLQDSTPLINVMLVNTMMKLVKNEDILKKLAINTLRYTMSEAHQKINPDYDDDEANKFYCEPKYIYDISNGYSECKKDCTISDCI